MSKSRLAEATYAAIVALIEDQAIQVGQRLPSEAHLATSLGVSRTVVREALVRLAADGLTESRRGSGSFVTRLPSKLLKQYMPFSELSTTLGTYEVRFVLESEAARLAAIRRSEEDMQLIEQCLEQLRVSLLSQVAAHVEDMALHRAIMCATANDAFVRTFDALSADIALVMQAGVDISRSRSQQVTQSMMSEHDDIVSSIRSFDADRAALSMRWHLSQGRRRLIY